MDIAIVGGHGQIARHLTRLLHDRGDAVRGIVRNPNHAPDLESDGARPLIIDLEAADPAASELTTAVRGTDAVVFAAGAGPGSGGARKWTMDHEGVVKTIAACKLAGVSRIVEISSMGAEDPPEADDDFSVYLRAKARAEAELRESGLDYTIVRPGKLTDDAQTGTVTAARHVDRGEITRADVAAVLVAVLDEPASGGRTFELVGGSVPVADAVAAVCGQDDTRP